MTLTLARRRFIVTAAGAEAVMVATPESRAFVGFTTCQSA